MIIHHPTRGVRNKFLYCLAATALGLLLCSSGVESFVTGVSLRRCRRRRSRIADISRPKRISRIHASAKDTDPIWKEKTSGRRQALASMGGGAALLLTVLSGGPAPVYGLEALTGNDSTVESNSASLSSTQQKPFAPLSKLLPAARVQWTIDRSLAIAQSIMQKDVDKTDNSWERLRDLLLEPQNYMSGERLPQVPNAPAHAYLDTYQRNRKELAVLAKPGALLVQSGEIAAWKRLKGQERRREEEDEIRAALNVYTSALTYSSDSYLLRVAASERKEMIRQDRLPDVKQVIQSDMGMRYLYRNELLTSMQEVRAELAYQLEQPQNNNGGSPSSTEDLIPLLQSAQTACSAWFACIDPRDVQEAQMAVAAEKNK